MDKFNFKKTQKKKLNTTRKSIMRGGSAIRDAFTTKCDFSTKYGKKTANIYGWTKDNLIKKLPSSDFAKLENPKFMNIFKQNLETFCVKNYNRKYLKFCINFMSCANKPEKMYNLLYQMYIFEKASKKQREIKDNKAENIETNSDEKKLPTKSERLYKDKKKMIKLTEGNEAADNYSRKQFVIDFEKENINNVSKFIINVIKKSIVSYEKMKPPTPGEKSEIVMKDKIEKLFTSLFGNKFEFTKITQEELEKILSENKKTIEEYSDSRLMSITSEELVDDDKEVKKSSFYLYVVFGAFITALFLESGFLAAPPGLKGGMS